MKYQKPATERVQVIGRMRGDHSGIVYCSPTHAIPDCVEVS